MLEIPLNAPVECTDGHAGKATHIIIHPQQRIVTHIVVQNDKNTVAQDRLVPIEMIGETSSDVIRLKCTLADVETMAPFSTTRYVGYDYDTYETYSTYASYNAGMGGPYMIPTTAPAYAEVVDEAMPEGGGRALMKGAKVEATDGVIGTVGELVIDQDSGQITHFTLQESNLWGKNKKEVILPLSAVRFAEEDIVHLKLDKKAIKALPAFARKTKANKQGKAGMVELIARVFDQPNKAAESLAFIKELQRQQHGALKIHNSALLVKVAEFEKSIADLQATAETQRAEFQAVIDGQVMQISGLTTHVSALNDSVGRLTAEKNTAYVVIGTKEELIKKGVLVAEGSKRFVVAGSRQVKPARTLDPSVFTKLDRTVDRTIILPAGKYEILSRQNPAYASPVLKNGKIAGVMTIEQPDPGGVSCTMRMSPTAVSWSTTKPSWSA